MTPWKLHSFTGAQPLVDAVALRWLSELAQTQNTSFSAALSGGRIAHEFFKTVAMQVATRHVSLHKVHFFWGDERCVPPEHTESNFAAANKFLLQPLGIPESQIHRVCGEEPPAFAAAQAEVELRRFAPLNAYGLPVLDLIFLGMGEDGHVASLFTGESEEVMAAPAIYRAVTATKPPPQRITLGYGAIAAARQVWVLASGASKEEALRESLKPEGGTPLARMLRMREHTVIFTDIKMDGAK